MSKYGPMRREYSRVEVAAARRLKLAFMDKVERHGEFVRELGGPLVWAAGPYWPNRAREKAHDWALVADAMEREWTKEIHHD